MRMPPWNSAQRLRSLPQKHTTQTNQRLLMIVRTNTRMAIKAGIKHRDRNLQQARKKIAKCTQLFFRIRSSGLTIPIYFMKYTIEMKFVRKIISTHIKCRGKAQVMQKTVMRWMRVVPRESRNIPSLRCMILHPSIPSTQSLNSMGKVQTQVPCLGRPLILNINQAVSYQLMSLQSSEASSLMRLIIPPCKDIPSKER